MSIENDQFNNDYDAFGVLRKSINETDDRSGLVPNPVSESIEPGVIRSGQLNSDLAVVKGGIRSSNFVEGSVGWRIEADGDAEFNNITARGDITADSLTIGGGKEITVSAGESIQDAIDDVYEAGGGSVLLSNGTHSHGGSDINIYSDVYLKGLGSESCIIDFESTAFGIKIVGSNNYSTGTVTATNGSTTVTGDTTVWTSAMVGRYILLGGIWYPIAARVSNTEITLSLPYAGENLAAVTYVIATRIRDVYLETLTIKNSTVAALKVQYADEVWMNDLNIQTSAIGIDVDDSSNINVNTNDLVYNAYGYDFDNVHFSVIQKSGSIITSTGDHYNFTGCTSCTLDAIFGASSAANGVSFTSCKDMAATSSTMIKSAGKGWEFVSGNSFIELTSCGGIASASDNFKLTATTDNCTLASLVVRDAGGWGINIANANCDDNVVGSINYSNNTSGNLNDLGTGTSNISDTTVVPYLIASDTLQESADTERNNETETYAKVKEIVVRVDGVVRVKFDLKAQNTGAIAYGRIYVNGVAIGTERSTLLTTYQTYSEDITVLKNDLVQLYIK